MDDVCADMHDRYLSRRLVNDGMEVLYGPPDIIPNRIQVRSLHLATTLAIELQVCFGPQVHVCVG